MSQMQVGSMIFEFLNKEDLFKASIESMFDSLDTNDDGLISFAEMGRELISLTMMKKCLGIDLVGLSHVELMELQRDVFSGYDRDGGRKIDLEEFREEMREMLIAVASLAKSML